MKRVLSAGVALSAAVFLSGCVYGDRRLNHRASVDETRPLASEGRFTLENTNGRVEVAAWDGAEVRIEATKHAVSEQALERLEVEIDGEPDHVRVRTRHPRSRWMGGAGRVDYFVRVPRTARVRVENVNGRVEVTGVAAEVAASTVNGSVEVRDARGTVDASAVNGSVRASLERVDPRGRSRLHTTNGSVRLTLPADADADVEAGAVNGGVSCDFELAGRKSRRKLDGRIGSGGARFDLGAVNGSVSIDRGLGARADARAPAEAPSQTAR